MTTEAQRQGLGLYVNWGFTLEHSDDHVVELHHQGELVGRFSQLGATEESLQKACANHLVLRHHWNGCIWSRKGGQSDTGKRG